MAYYFAELDSNSIVTRVVVVSNENNTNSDGNEDESVGIAFCRSLYGANTNWKQSPYNSSIRKNPAGIGNLYNAELDEFIAQQPYSSWTLDSNTAQWVSPLGAEPTLTDEQIASNSYYRWNEDAYQADNTTGWVLETPETE